MFRSREDSTASTHLVLPPVDEPEDTTSLFSVATLRDLVARSAEDPTARAAPVAPEAPRLSPSVPAFLDKGGAVLVMPESGPRLIAAPVAEPSGAPAVAQLEAPAPTAAPAANPAPIATPDIRRTERTNPRAVRAVAPRRRTSVWPYLRCRLFALGFLALVVASQPWWWNIGDMRAHHGAPSAPPHDVAP
jgi:hypothetical protein